MKFHDTKKFTFSPSVLVIYYCRTNYHRLGTHIFYLIVSVGQKSGHSLAGPPAWGLSREVAFKVLAKAKVSSGSSIREGSSLKLI